MDYIPEYQGRANKSIDVVSVHPDYDKITKDTFGIMIYQEQVMRVAQVLGGYSAGEADILRKAVGKKKAEILEPALKELHQRMIEHGTPEEVAQKVCDDIRPFAGYAFNRSHAAAYAFIAYQTAYFKTYYPLEFMAALLTIFASDKEKVKHYIMDAKQMGINVLSPDINKSGIGFTIEENTLRFGLLSIDGLGKAAVDYILNNRPFKSIDYMIETAPKRNLNKKSLGVLALSGALDSLKPEGVENRMGILQYIYQLRGDKDDISEEIESFDTRARLAKEQELLGLFVSGHPLDDVCDPLNWNAIGNMEKFETGGIITSFKTILTKKEEPMAFVNVETAGGNERVVLFPSVYQSLDVKLKEGLIVKMKLLKKYDAFRDENSYIANQFTIPKRINKHILSK